jgi:hypothetical protein
LLLRVVHLFDACALPQDLDVQISRIPDLSPKIRDGLAQRLEHLGPPHLPHGLEDRSGAATGHAQLVHSLDVLGEERHSAMPIDRPQLPQHQHLGDDIERPGRLDGLVDDGWEITLLHAVGGTRRIRGATAVSLRRTPRRAPGRSEEIFH